MRDWFTASSVSPSVAARLRALTSTKTTVPKRLATLTLDLLVGELGVVRQGFNPLLILGEAEAPPPDPGGH